MPSSKDYKMFMDEMEAEMVGKRRGVKHDSGKPRMALLPLKQMEGVARVMEYGVAKYAVGDWRYVDNGHDRYLDAAMRHIAEHLNGQLDDTESGLCHLDHAIASLIMARYFV